MIAKLFCALIATSLAYAQDPSYRFELTRAYDAARVEPKMFAIPTLLQEFRVFVTRECENRKLARLTVAPTQQELLIAVNASFIDLNSAAVAMLSSSSPSVFGQSVDRLRAGQVLCIGGNATAAIRNGFNIERYQLAGTKDSRELNLGGVDVTLVGFSLHGGGDAWISAFVRAKVLPNLDTAAAIPNRIEEQTGVQAGLIIRTDPFFWDMGGPKFDVFEPPLPKISAEEFLTRPYVSCPPSDEHKALVKTAH